MWPFRNRKHFTTGVLTRDQLTDFIRITWVNLGSNSEFHKYQVYDWSKGSPILLRTELVQINPMEAKSSDIKVVSSGYGDLLDVKQYEVRLSIAHKKNNIVNIFGLSNAGVINEGNTILYSQLIPITYRHYNFNY